MCQHQCLDNVGIQNHMVKLYSSYCVKSFFPAESFIIIIHHLWLQVNRVDLLQFALFHYNVYVFISSQYWFTISAFNATFSNSELKKYHICATENLPSNQIILIKWKTYPSFLYGFRFLMDSLIKVCWCRPPQDIDYISADIKRVRDSTLHSMWVEERNSSIRQRGE